jgi:pSer/pThr/pTyr-binding forkhead associated (FHA) protein
MATLIPTLPAPARGSELQAVLRVEQSGDPFVLFRDEGEELQILVLPDADGYCTVGRHASNDIAMPWDSQVSRVHAELERIGGYWAVTDDGLSRNGTFLNGERIHTRRRLSDGDSVRVGGSVLIFRAPDGGPNTDTEQCLPPLVKPELTTNQRQVLVALCRPFKSPSGFVAPATNQHIAEELFMSVDRVKTHLRALFEKFGLAQLPQNRKRLELVQRALLAGSVTPADL